MSAREKFGLATGAGDVGSNEIKHMKTCRKATEMMFHLHVTIVMLNKFVDWLVRRAETREAFLARCGKTACVLLNLPNCFG